MKVLVIGSGGREHALAWKAAASPLVSEVFVAPGNAGTRSEPRVSNVNISVNDGEGLARFADGNHIDLTIVGPEGPLVAGIVDLFQIHGLACFGPRCAPAKLEGSKTFSKEFLLRHQIPTAAFRSFTEQDEALQYLDEVDFPIVVKADGLAAGKGVIIAETRDVAVDAIKDMLSGNSFGEAGRQIVVEEFLDGEEASFICMVDGQNILPMASSQDHKAAYNGDTGPNTGGMGAYSPAPIVDEAMHARILETIIRPTVDGLSKESMPYTGFLYAGVMIGLDGTPRVLEYNCRFGDPETQPIMMRLESDLVEHCLAAINGTLHSQTASWSSKVALGIVMAAEGYPESYHTGHRISGLFEIDDADVKVFHAGTDENDGDTVTSGGRVLCVTALGPDVQQSRDKAYHAAKSISWKGSWYRDDIGYRAIERLKEQQQA
jgi:phosphoribosylamine--glycine ligase